MLRILMTFFNRPKPEVTAEMQTLADRIAAVEARLNREGTAYEERMRDRRVRNAALKGVR